jgi:hypothetical protein
MLGHNAHSLAQIGKWLLAVDEDEGKYLTPPMALSLEKLSCPDCWPLETMG